jgi:hypothetical protein
MRNRFCFHGIGFLQFQQRAWILVFKSCAGTRGLRDVAVVAKGEVLVAFWLLALVLLASDHFARCPFELESLVIAGVLPSIATTSAAGRFGWISPFLRTQSCVTGSLP